MRSRVKRTPRAIEPLTTNRKEVQINLNEEEQEDPIPLEYNFSTQNYSKRLIERKNIYFLFP